MGDHDVVFLPVSVLQDSFGFSLLSLLLSDVRYLQLRPPNQRPERDQDLPTGTGGRTLELLGRTEKLLGVDPQGSYFAKLAVSGDHRSPASSPPSPFGTVRDPLLRVKRLPGLASFEAGCSLAGVVGLFRRAPPDDEDLALPRKGWEPYNPEPEPTGSSAAVHRSELPDQYFGGVSNHERCISDPTRRTFDERAL